MLTFENPYLAAIGTRADLERVCPYLAQAFDPIVLDRPGFLEEVGLQPADGLVLRAGALGQTWLRNPLFARALTEEIRSRVPHSALAAWLRDYPELTRDEQWLIVERIYARLEQLTGLRPGPKLETLGTELSMSRRELDEERSRWKERAAGLSQQLAAAIHLQLMLPPPDLEQQVSHHWATRFLVFHNDRPLLTDLGQVQAELQVRLGERVVSRSLAEEVERSRALGPELWTRAWLHYLGSRRNLQPSEFSAVLDELAGEGRHLWPQLVPAGGGARARRGVAAVACELLESLADRPEPAELQRLYELLDNFSERYDLEAIVRRRFTA